MRKRNKFCHDATSNNINATCYKTAILKVAYDGTYFRGSAGHKVSKDNVHQSMQKDDADADASKSKSVQQRPQQSSKRRQSRRSRTLQRKGGYYGKNNGNVRTVVDTLRSALAKIYGNVDPNQITIDSCSRTDAGVHATSLILQFYCSPRNSTHSMQIPDDNSNSQYDTTNLLPLPFDSDLSKLVFVLNRMLPPDLRVVGATNNGDFHPALDTLSKTYRYKFAIGPIHDPLQTQYVWHLDGSSARAVGMNGKRFSLQRALQAADLFVDSNDKNMSIDTAKPRDYGAFRSAFRGSDRGRVQSTLCKMHRCEILQEMQEQLPVWDKDDALGGSIRHQGSRLGKALTGSREEDLKVSPQTLTVVITGDRFLYKMVRNIVGTIVAVGCGHIELDDVSYALDAGRWGGNQSGEEGTIRRICAPARGLTLVDVQYPTDVHLDWQTG